MIKKATARRQACQQAVQKQRTGRKTYNQSKFSQLGALLPAEYRKKLYKASESCFKLVGYCCCKLSFAPISVDSDGKYVTRKSLREQSLHYCLLVLQCIWFIYHLVSVVTTVVSGGMDLATVLCISQLLVSLVGLSVPASLLLKKYETVQLVNTLPTIMQYFPKNGRALGFLENSKSVVSVLGITALTAVIAALSTTMSFMLPSMPGSLYHIFSMTGIPLSFPKVPPIVWKLLIWPVELFMATQSMVLTAWSVMIFMTIFYVGIVWTESLRNIPVDTVTGWKVLRKRYFLFQVVYKLYNSWVKLMSIPTISVVCGAIVMMIYITIRHTQLPILFYIGCIYVGITDTLIVCWINFEMITMIRETEGIQQTLVTHSQLNFPELPPEQRLYLKKWGKATRPVVVSIGNLMDYSMDVPIGMWDEILNQLLFLLTL